MESLGAAKLPIGRSISRREIEATGEQRPSVGCSDRAEYSANRHLVMLIAKVESVLRRPRFRRGTAPDVVPSDGSSACLPPCPAIPHTNPRSPDPRWSGRAPCRARARVLYDRDNGAGLNLNGVQHRGLLRHRRLRSRTAATHLFVLGDGTTAGCHRSNCCSDVRRSSYDTCLRPRRTRPCRATLKEDPA